MQTNSKLLTDNLNFSTAIIQSTHDLKKLPVNAFSCVILGPISAGKTTLVRQLSHFFKTKFINQHDKYEYSRGLTLFTRINSFSYKSSFYTFFDTPGHNDFRAECDVLSEMVNCRIRIYDINEFYWLDTQVVFEGIIIFNKFDTFKGDVKLLFRKIADNINSCSTVFYGSLKLNNLYSFVSKRPVDWTDVVKLVRGRIVKTVVLRHEELDNRNHPIILCAEVLKKDGFIFGKKIIRILTTLGDGKFEVAEVNKNMVAMFELSEELDNADTIKSENLDFEGLNNKNVLLRYKNCWLGTILTQNRLSDVLNRIKKQFFNIEVVANSIRAPGEMAMDYFLWRLQMAAIKMFGPHPQQYFQVEKVFVVNKMRAKNKTDLNFKSVNFVGKRRLEKIEEAGIEEFKGNRIIFNTLIKQCNKSKIVTGFKMVVMKKEIIETDFYCYNELQEKTVLEIQDLIFEEVEFDVIIPRFKIEIFYFPDSRSAFDLIFEERGICSRRVVYKHSDYVHEVLYVDGDAICGLECDLSYVSLGRFSMITTFCGYH